MGGLISFELTHELHRQHDLVPMHLLIAGHRAPNSRTGLPRFITCQNPSSSCNCVVSTAHRRQYYKMQN
jgi:surfactin synthase thioesterase subunit